MAHRWVSDRDYDYRTSYFGTTTQEVVRLGDLSHRENILGWRFIPDAEVVAHRLLDKDGRMWRDDG